MGSALSVAETMSRSQAWAGSESWRRCQLSVMGADWRVNGSGLAMRPAGSEWVSRSGTTVALVVVVKIASAATVVGTIAMIRRVRPTSTSRSSRGPRSRPRREIAMCGTEMMASGVGLSTSRALFREVTSIIGSEAMRRTRRLAGWEVQRRYQGPRDLARDPGRRSRPLKQPAEPAAPRS